MSFDANLSKEQQEKARRMRASMYRAKSFNVDPDPAPSPGAKSFDDCFRGDYVKLSRAKELRRTCKIKIYWDNASDEEKNIIRQACKEIEPFVGNKILIKNILTRKNDYLIRDKRVQEYVAKSVLAI